MRRVQLVYGNFSRSAVFTELHEGGINRDAGQPGCKLGSSIKILEMDESIQKAVLRCVFRVFAASHDPMDDTEDFCAMAFAKLPEGGSSSSLSGCDQLLLAPSSKIAKDRKSTRLNSSHPSISYAVFCLKKKKKK